jgi:hypothetical protein
MIARSCVVSAMWMPKSNLLYACVTALKAGAYSFRPGTFGWRPPLRGLLQASLLMLVVKLGEILGEALPRHHRVESWR